MTKSIWLASAAALIAATPAVAQNTSTPTGDNTSSTAVLGAVDAASPATAAAADEGAQGGEIVITATRRSQTLGNVPIAVSAVTAESLQNSGATDIRALNQLAPSLLVSSTSSEANGSARIRGIGTVGDNPGLESSVAVFVDGVYRSRSGIGLNELGEVERIEVLRGPQGTLFGRNASAGLINIISKKPSFETEGSAALTYGNYDYIRGEASLTGAIGDSKTLAYRIDGVYVKRDGFLDNVTAGGGSESKLNNRNRYFVRGQLLWEPTDALSVRAIGDYTHRKESCCGAVYINQRETFDPTPNGATTNGTTVNNDQAVSTSASNRIVDVLRSLGAVYPLAGNTPDPYSRNAAVTPGRSYKNVTRDYGGSVQADYKLGDSANLTSITAYRQYKAGGAGDFDYTNIDLTYRPNDGNAYRQFKTFTQELRLQGSAFNDRLDWLVGGFYTNEKLTVHDNIKFGTQYGAFASCRIVATVSPNALLRNPASPGCLSTTPNPLLGGASGRQAFGAGFGALAPAILAGVDRLSTLNDLGDNLAVYNQDSENYAFFTHNIFKITDRLSLTLGARYTHEKKDFDANFNNNNTVCPAQQTALSPLLANPAVVANPALGSLIGGIITLTCTGNSSSSLNALALNDSRSESEVTGTGVLSWKATDNLLTYASYSKGYKAGGYNLDRSDLGGPNGVFSPRTNADAAGLQFDAEKVDAYELGFKFSSRRFNLNVAAFRQEFKNFQLNTFNGSIFIVQNIQACRDDLNGADTDSSRATGACAAGRSDKPGVISQGVELEATLFPTRHFQVSAGYTYADTHYRRNLIGSSTGESLDPALFLLSGDNLSNAPKHTVTASGSWTPDIGTSGLSGLLYLDTRMTSDYNTGSDLAPEKEQDGYILVNARVGLRGPDQRWSVELWAQNLFNIDYTQVGFNTPFQGAGSSANVQRFGGTGNALYSAFLAEPRTYGLTVRTKF